MNFNQRKVMLGALVSVCLVGTVIHWNSYANDSEKVENEQKLEKENEILTEIQNLDSQSIQYKSLDDISINRDKNLPLEVGIDATLASAVVGKYPTLPGFTETSNGLGGNVPNGEKTRIDIVEGQDEDGNDCFIVTTTSAILYDEMVQSYVKQILAFYDGKKYTVDIGGIEATIIIKK